MKRFAFILLLLCAFGILVSTAWSQKVGTTSMQFLKVMPCARATALGDAYTVWARGAEAMFWNPGNIAYIQGQEFSTTYIWWMMDTKIGALSYAASLGDIGAVGASIQYVDYGVMEEATWEYPYIKNAVNPGLTGNTFRPFAVVAALAYSRQLTDKFSTGLTLKYAHESLYNGDMVTAMTKLGTYEKVKTWANGLMFDFGMTYNTGYKSIQTSIAVQNFGADVTYAKVTNPLPMQFRWGIAANILGPDAIVMQDPDNRLALAFDLFQPNDYAQQAHVGIEYEFGGIIAVRGGYKFNYDSESVTIGGGLHQSLGSIRLTIDYSYGAVGNYLGDVHRITLGAGF